MIDPSLASRIANAKRISEELPHETDPEAYMRKELEQEYIRGGIGATEAILGSIPARVMDLPDDQRKVMMVVTRVIQELQDRMKGYLK